MSLDSLVLLLQAELLNKLGPHLPTLLMLGGMAVICFLLLRNSAGVSRRLEKSHGEEARSLVGERSRDSALADAPNNVLQWQIELHQTARDLKGDMDTKILLLQTLLKEVKEERERLEALLAETKELRQAAPKIR